MSQRKYLWIVALAASSLFSAAAFAFVPPPVTLTNGSVTATIDPYSAAGMSDWNVQGQHALAQQWFWYRTADMTTASAINTIGLQSVTTPTANSAVITYGNATLTVSITYLLSGSTTPATPGTYASPDMGESITIINNTNSPLDLHFFQYSNFNLNVLNSDTVALYRSGPQNRFVIADQTDSTNVNTLAETVVTRLAGHGEVATAGTTVTNLETIPAYTLSDVAGPMSGDVAWALEWDFVGAGIVPDYAAIPASGSITISKDKNLSVLIPTSGSDVPEPATVLVMGMGALALLARRRGMSGRR